MQTGVEAAGKIPRIDPGPSQTKTSSWRKIPGISLDPTVSNADTYKIVPGITAGVSRTKTGALRNTQGITSNAYRNKTERITPEPHKSETAADVNAKILTASQPSGNGRTAAGKGFYCCLHPNPYSTPKHSRM